MGIDLRSDTVTKPTPEMYAAMQSAALGDDVLLDDPTVSELEHVAAEIMGKEAAVFVPSGTMGNQMAIATHCSPGDAMIVEEEAHVVYYEVGGPSMHAGVLTWTLPSDGGTMDPDYLEARVLKSSLHTPGTRLICLENTHNRAGGRVISIDAHQRYRDIADRHGLLVHLDGARVFNASVALGVDVKEIASRVDTVNFCLSKGLRAPVGSVLCGPSEFIERARVWRKRFGGGMRQAGLLAACGLISLKTMIPRLADDHAHAKLLANGLNGLPGLDVSPDLTETNIVLVSTSLPATVWVDALARRNVHFFPVASHRFRLVTHADVSSSEIHHAIEAFAEAASELSS